MSINSFNSLLFLYNDAIKLLGTVAQEVELVSPSLVAEVPPSKYEIENFSKLVKFEMENAIKLSVPLKVDFNWGASWFDAH